MSLSKTLPNASSRIGRMGIADMQVEKIDSAKWTALAEAFCGRTYQQAPSYAQCAASHVNARAELISVSRNGNLLGLAAARIKEWPLVPIRLVYVHGGPIYSPRNRIEAFSECAMGLADHYVTGARTLLRIVPASNTKDEADEQTAVLLAMGFVRARSRAYRTLVKRIDITDAPLRNSFDQKWRRDLGRGEKAGLAITRGTASDDMRRFELLHDGLRTKKRFHVRHDASFFAEVQRKATPLERIVVHIAWSDGNPVAGHVGCIMGDTAVYLLGAADERGRNSRASFLLQWEFMRYAREQGVLWYDLGGIDPENNPDVYRFKKRLNAEQLTWAGSFDYATVPLVPAIMGIFQR